ncbi:predicted protein [Uncinocarpus reesii 1704]|uniref:Uncharacterized protein n=1 Tax=Uncinocarpus reesii (strain UAMH 1704) TaxID=336963 RepID=C4JXY3_UNCRE|nr:uncharacterized protein UREG_07034 [Uncinocarpus reesii 1704]EEP82169.1 predicted protein [Uncinocarpus reesii 1704]
MPSNKDRFYVALYHWAFFVSPKDDPDGDDRTVRHHATNKILLRDGTMQQTWQYQQDHLKKVKTTRLLCRILIGKVEKPRQELESSLRRVPIVQDDPNWRCRTWTANAVEQLAKDGILSSRSITDWSVIEAGCRAYIQKKIENGRFTSLTTTIPTYDLMARMETVP